MLVFTCTVVSLFKDLQWDQESVVLYCRWSLKKGHLTQSGIWGLNQLHGLIIKGGLKIKGCKIEGPLYSIFTD